MIIIANTKGGYEENFVREVFSERERQDTQWGGRIHDDTHSQEDWFKLINRYMAPHGDDFEVRMIKVAALALAAVESNRRKHGNT